MNESVKFTHLFIVRVIALWHFDVYENLRGLVGFEEKVDELLSSP
jgi:hypothetical protein